MAYATGTAATANALLSAIQTFAAAQGWTVDYSGVDGAGQRLHISKSSVWANFSTNYVPASNLFGLQMSSGFTASANAWNAQTAPLGTVRSCPLTIGASPILPCTYHLFAQTNPDVLAGVMVGASNVTTYFVIGNVNKIGSYVGGAFGSAGDYLAQAGSSLAPVNVLTEVKGPSSWLPVYSFGYYAGVDTNTNLAPLMPIRLFELSGSAYKPRGVVPWARCVSRNYANGDEITYGADVWKVFYSSDPTSRYMIGFKK